MGNLKRAGLFFTLLMATTAISADVTAQSSAIPLRIVNVTEDGIAFFEVGDDNTLKPLGEPLSDFAVEYFAGHAEWMILAKESFAVSPDGRFFAFTAQRGDEAALFIYSADDGSLQQHSIVSYWLLPTLWSPDSGAVLLNPALPYLGELPKPFDYVYEITTDTLFQITFTDDWKVFQWSADGDSIVYFGTCDPNPCGSSQEDLYLVSRDGSTRFPLTNFTAQFQPDVDKTPCFITWSPEDQRWYYVLGCGSLLDVGPAYIYSTSVNGDSRLEIELEDYLRSTDGVNVYFNYALVNGIHPRPEGIYFSLQLSFVPVVSDTNVTELRVLRLGRQGQLDTVYRDIDSNLGTVDAELTGSAISPNGHRMALFFVDRAFIIDIANDWNIGEVPGEQEICDVRWKNNDTVVYNVGGDHHTCRGVGYTNPEAAKIFNVVTGEVVSLTEDLEGIAWALPITDTGF